MTFSITAQLRKGKAQDARESQHIPGVLYGPEIEPQSISVDYNTFDKLYNEAGESSLIDFVIEGGSESAKVLIQDVQYDPVKRTISHVDFRQIKMGEEMEATIELEFVGESQAVKQGGTLNEATDSITVRCLPKDLVSSIEVDLSKLETFDDAIYVKDITLPAGMTTVDNPDDLVAKVAAPLSDDQLAAMEVSQIGDVASVEVEGAKEGAEGEDKKDAEKNENAKDGKKSE